MDTITKPAAPLPNTAPAPIQPATQSPRLPRQAPTSQVRRSKADSLRLAARLKRTMMAITMLSFGAFSVAIGSRLATTASTSSNTSTTSTTTTTSTSSDDGSYFSSGSSNIGTSGSSSSSSTGTVGGSSVS